MSIKDNLEKIRQNVAKACAQCGRNPDDVLILAVTKTRTADEINEAIRCGITDGKRPGSFATREEVAVMVLRGMKQAE